MIEIKVVQDERAIESCYELGEGEVAWLLHILRPAQNAPPRGAGKPKVIDAIIDGMCRDMREALEHHNSDG